MMMKYMTTDNDKKLIVSFEADIIEALKQQLNDKAIERLDLLTRLNELENENKKLTQKLANCETQCKTLIEENQTDRKSVV